MATQYFPVSFQWAPGTFPNPELQAVVYNKALEMQTAGKMANGKLHKHLVDAPVVPDGYTLQTVERGISEDREKPPEGPITFNFVYDVDHITKKVTMTIDPTVTQKAMRILKTEADANEIINFIMELGALNCIILTNDDLIAEGIILPDDSIIATYFNPG
jgi:hypothetical protein